MRFLIFNTDYPAFLAELYRSHPRLADAPFTEQQQVRASSFFGVADFYPRNLRALGHEAYEFCINNLYVQRAWAREHNLRSWKWDVWPWPFLPRRRFLPAAASWYYGIIEAQIRHYQPDVVLNHDPLAVSAAILRGLKPLTPCLVVQHAALPLRSEDDWSVYDLALSSFPPTVDWFRAHGLRAELFRLGFDPSVLEHLESREQHIPVSFVGSLQQVHSSRREWLEAVCRSADVSVWTPDIDAVPAGSPIRKCYRGAAFGREMFQILRDSRITLNHHGNVPPFANNMRLYEATGTGTLLMTDWKQNLADMFVPGHDVAAYRGTEDCIQQINYYLEHEEERQAIAKHGQDRVLREHTYRRRMQELVRLIDGGSQ